MGETWFTHITPSTRATRCTPKYWDRPWEAGADDYAYGAVKRPDGFVGVGSTQGAPRGDSPDAAQIRIPSINVDSEIKTSRDHRHWR